MYSVLHLGLSYACNMKCRHCFVERNEDCLDTEQIITLIDELYQQGLMFLYFTYGEPLLARNLFEVAAFAKSRNLIQILMTNGYLVTEQTIEQIRENGISNVFISLDSSRPEEHDENRGKEGAFDAAVKSIRLLRSHKVRVGISTAVTQKNAHRLKEIYDIAMREDVRIISCLRGRKNGTMVPLDPDAKGAYICFVRFCLKQSCINLKFHDLELLPYFKQWHEEGSISDLVFEKYYHMSCCHADSTLSIAPNGDVSNCNLINNRICNINELSKGKLRKGLAENENNVCCTPFS